MILRKLSRATGLACVLAVVARLTAAGEISPAQRRSGYADMSQQTRAMQNDDKANPGMLWVLEGEELWNRDAGKLVRSCASCHGKARESMKGVAARYPRFDPALGKAVDLEDRIRTCRRERQQATYPPFESQELLSLTAYVAYQSRGMPINPGSVGELELVEAGRELFGRPQGQLGLACARCHDDNWGKRLAGNVVPQAHPTGYPVYRLEWQSLGSLQRRIRSCMLGMRAEPYDYGAPENIALEAFLMWRARDMPIETPGVRP
jgi:L-cysteine S-thiosulfotransferase